MVTTCLCQWRKEHTSRYRAAHACSQLQNVLNKAADPPTVAPGAKWNALQAQARHERCRRVHPSCTLCSADMPSTSAYRQQFRISAINAAKLGGDKITCREGTGCQPCLPRGPLLQPTRCFQLHLVNEMTTVPRISTPIEHVMRA